MLCWIQTQIRELWSTVCCQAKTSFPFSLTFQTSYLVLIRAISSHVNPWSPTCSPDETLKVYVAITCTNPPGWWSGWMLWFSPRYLLIPPQPTSPPPHGLCQPLAPFCLHQPVIGLEEGREGHVTIRQWTNDRIDRLQICCFNAKVTTCSTSPAVWTIQLPPNRFQSFSQRLALLIVLS